FTFIHTSHPDPLTFHSFFFNDPAPTDIYTLSLHDALPIWQRHDPHHRAGRGAARQRIHHDRVDLRRWLHSRAGPERRLRARPARDRKSTCLNSSHVAISYAVFCLKKKKQEVAASGRKDKA